MKQNKIKPKETNLMDALIRIVKESKLKPKYAKYIDEKGNLVVIIK